MSNLFDPSAAMYVIAGLIADPSIAHDEDNFKLTTNDFHDEFYKILFASIYNLAIEGASSISAQDVDLYIGQFSKQYTVYSNQKGYEFLLNLEETYVSNFDHAKFRHFYDRMKKFTILRDLNKAGINTTEFYNPNPENFLELDNESRKLNETTIEEIMHSIKNKINRVEDSYVSKKQQTSQKASKGIRELYFELKETPEIGDQLDGDIMNYAVRGARFGKFYLISAPSGHGKTRQMVGHACSLSLPRIEENNIIYRENLRPVLFVTTEQKADEIQTLLLAYVSGVNERKILYGTCTFEEEKRVLMAIELIEEYGDNFILEVIPDPSINLVRTKLIKHILNNDVHYIFYDYIFSSPGLLSEFRDLKVREDVALMMLSNTLKEIAADYQVFVMSATQLNDKWETSRVRNQNHIRGSKAIVDKIDVGMITVKLEEVQDEHEQVKLIFEAAGLTEEEYPNMVVDIYKNRRGEYAGVKLFKRFDHGTCRTVDVMLTSTTYRVIDDYDEVEYEYRRKDLLDLMTERLGGDNSHE